MTFKTLYGSIVKNTTFKYAKNTPTPKNRETFEKPSSNKAILEF